MKYKQLSIEEREKIQEMLWQGSSVRSIARQLNRSHTSILRELNRHNRDRTYQYKPRLAQERALIRRKSRGRTQRLKNEAVRDYVIFRLKKKWSPEQISGRIFRDIGECISHEAIYQFIYYQVHRDGYGYLRPGCEDLRSCLRRRRKRRIRKGLRLCQKLPKFQGISIDQRSSLVNERKRFGDWEGDSVESINHKPGINTLVERKSGLTFITKLKDKTSASTTAVINHRFKNLPTNLKLTLTMDNGSENSGWKEVEQLTNTKCYFAHPYHAWERGSNENTNGLIRDYFPKKTDFSMIPEEEIQFVEYELNTRPRKRLNYLTPLEVISGAVTG